MTVFSGADAVREFFEELDEWLSESVAVFLLGGSAMTIRGLKDQTEDIDIALGVVAEFEHVLATLTSRGFTVTDEPTKPFEGVGRTVKVYNPDRDLEIDLFEQQVVGKVWLTPEMRERATAFWSGSHVTAFVLADEDMFLLKAVSGGDPASGRRRDIEDMRIFVQRGLDYETILEEIDAQRPFNTGAIEARQLRERSHPLFTIEIAVTALSGLPDSFTDRVSAFATEFEVESLVVGTVEDGVTDIETIRDHVLDEIQTLSSDRDDAVDAAIERLVEKGILDTDGETVHRRA